MKFLFDFKNQKSKVFLISKHQGNLEEKLKELGIFYLFDAVFHLKKEQNKYDFMEEGSILIDDSFKERNSVREKGFLAFPVEFFYSEI